MVLDIIVKSTTITISTDATLVVEHVVNKAVAF